MGLLTLDATDLLTCDLPKRSLESPRECFDMLDALDASLRATCRSIDRAAVGGFNADRLGYAFLAGYRAALARLDASLRRASLCATEEGGAHPRAIKTRLTRLRVAGEVSSTLTGKKTFATLASTADVLLVVASLESDSGDGLNHLCIARVPADRQGVVVRDRPPLPFAPEIPHAEVTFDHVRVQPNEVLDGDGYTSFLKPFRTLEDTHVMAAFCGHVVRLVREHDGPRDVAERALTALAALTTVSDLDPVEPSTHVVLAGVLDVAKGLVRDWNLAECDETTRARWQRDIPLLEVAGTARKLRREAAWAKLTKI